MIELILHIAQHELDLTSLRGEVEWDTLCGPFVAHREVRLTHQLPVTIGPEEAHVPVRDHGRFDGVLFVHREGMRVTFAGHPVVRGVRWSLGSDGLLPGPLPGGVVGDFTLAEDIGGVSANLGARYVLWNRVVLWIEARPHTEEAAQLYAPLFVPHEEIEVQAKVSYLGGRIGSLFDPALGYEVTQEHVFTLIPGQSFTAARVPGTQGRSMMEVGHVVFERGGNLIGARRIWEQRVARIYHFSGERHTVQELTGRAFITPELVGVTGGTRSPCLLEESALVHFTSKGRTERATAALERASSLPPLRIFARVQHLTQDYTRMEVAREELIELVPDTEVVLGRLRSVDIFVDHSSLARRHVRFSRVGQRVFIHDNGTTNGSYRLRAGQPSERLPSMRAVEATLGLGEPVVEGDLFLIGRGALVRFEVHPGVYQAPERAVPPPPPSVAPPEPPEPPEPPTSGDR